MQSGNNEKCPFLKSHTKCVNIVLILTLQTYMFEHLVNLFQMSGLREM